MIPFVHIALIILLRDHFMNHNGNTTMICHDSNMAMVSPYESASSSSSLLLLSASLALMLLHMLRRGYDYEENLFYYISRT